jgi:branched-subunit amino acid transport protein
MTLWSAVIIASLAVYSWKLIGFVIPQRFVASSSVRELASLLTVALLAALVGIQTLVTSTGISFDARIPAVIAAAVMFYLRAPFVLVVFSAAAIAALLRLMF